MTITISRTMELKELIEDIARFDGAINNLSEQAKTPFILHLDFKVEDVRKLITENPNSDAVRVYLACKEDYNPYGVIAPVLDQSGDSMADAGITFYMDSAHCPPRCPKNYGFPMDSSTETQIS